MATTAATPIRPIPKPRTKIPASPPEDKILTSKISKPIPPPKPSNLLYGGQVKFRNPPLPSWSPPPSSLSASPSSPPSTTTINVSAVPSATDKSSPTSKNSDKIDLSPNGKMTSKNETNEEKKAAAEKIVNSLKDGVEALNEVLNNFESETDDETSSNKRLTVIEVKRDPSSELEENKEDDEPNYVNIEAIYKREESEDKTMAYLMTGEVVTESEIISCIENLDEDKTEVNDTSSEDETTKFSELSLEIADDSKTQIWIPQNLQKDSEKQINNDDTLLPGENEKVIEGSSKNHISNCPPPQSSSSSSSSPAYIDADCENSKKHKEDKEPKSTVIFRNNKTDHSVTVENQEDLSCSKDSNFKDSESIEKATEKVEESDNSKMAFREIQAQHRRAVAQVPPQAARPKPLERRKQPQQQPLTPLRRLQDCVPQEYTSSPIVQILAAAEEHPEPPRTLDDLSRSLAAMSTSSVFPSNGSKFNNNNNQQTFLMTNSCMPEVSPGSSSGSSGVSSSSDLQRPPSKVHEVQIRRIPNPQNRSSMNGLPRMGISSSYPAASTTLERIIRSARIWYLPKLGRALANQFLRPMPPGCFIVRSSTRPSSMALSIKLPTEYGMSTDHYLLERIGPSAVKLEGSPHIFPSLPLLIEYYCQTADELQCKLMLPPAILQCLNISDVQQIASLGKDFWTSELAQSGSSRSQSMPYRRQTSQPVMPVSRISSRNENENVKRLSQRIGSPIYSMNNNPSGDQQPQVDHHHPFIKPSAKPRKTLPTMNSMLLKKSQSENEGLQKDNISQASTTESASSKSLKPSKHFFRNLFSSSSNSIQPSTSSSPGSSRFYDGYSADPTTQKYSAYGYIPPRDPPTRDPSEPSSTSTSTTSSLRRSFAKFKNFNKTSSSRSKSKESKDDGAFNKLSSEAIKARQAAFRREQTDISASSVYRLATHHQNVGSSSPHSPTNQMFNVGSSSNSSFSSAKNPPLVPSKKVLDENAMQKCIDELRQKRMTSEKPIHSSTVSPKPTRDTSEIFKEFDGFIQNNGKPYEVILRNKKANQTRKPFQDRLSVPNLSEDPLLLSQQQQQQQNGGNFESTKFGRAPETGELQTINEGLITPVYRRKQFAALSGASPENYTNPEYFERRNGKVSMDSEIVKNEKEQSLQKQAPVVPQKPSSNSRTTNSARSQYSIVGPASSNSSTPSTTNPSATATKKIGPQSLLNWSEVNSEIKTRQRVAKVRPTPQPIPSRSPINSMSTTSKMSCTSSNTSSPSTEARQSKKQQSEYAQLSEFSDAYEPDTSIGSFHSVTTSHSQQHQASQYPSASETCDDDAVSVAGTVFNEPWDSTAWENLLDLARYGDEKSNNRLLAHNLYHNSAATIEEEDSLPIEVDDVVISCVDSDSDDQPLASPESVEIIQECDEKMEESADSLASLKSSSKKDVFSVENNRIWAEFSNRIPSEPSSKASTYDPRKIRSNSMMNVAGGAGTTLTRRALTPNNSSASASSQMSPSQRLRSASARPPVSDPGTRIQQYVESIAKDGKTVFGGTLNKFIVCTIEAEECDPTLQIRNVRQFSNGIKNYLVKHGEADLHAIIEAESANLNANEFLNIDAILEAVLHKILLVPVKNHLYHLMVKEHMKNGSLQMLSENLLKVRSMKPSELGFPEGTIYPDLKDMEEIKQCLRRMQNHYSPLKKLENLLKALSIVILPNRRLNNNEYPASKKSNNNLIQNGTLSGVLGSKMLPPAEELIRWIVYILAKTSTINCEIEAWYMWELLPQQLLTTGDAAYYLTTLFSAVHVLKNPESIRRLGKGFPLSPDPKRCPDEPADAFLSVAIPNEESGSIEYHVFPAVPQMNAGKLCRVIGRQFAITNPEDYGLYILFDGFETCLLANECPDAIRNQLFEAGKAHLFAYKRHEAKIAWPKHIINCSSSSSASTCSSNISPNGSDIAAFNLRPSHVIQPSPIHKRKHLPVASKIV